MYFPLFITFLMHILPIFLGYAMVTNDLLLSNILLNLNHMLCMCIFCSASSQIITNHNDLWQEFGHKLVSILAFIAEDRQVQSLPICSCRQESFLQ